MSPDLALRIGSASRFGRKPQEISSGLSEVTRCRAPSETQSLVMFFEKASEGGTDVASRWAQPAGPKRRVSACVLGGNGCY
jgi:hypothetical protein